MSDSALRGLEILEHLSRSRPLTAGEVARDLDMSRATVARLLESLNGAGWVVAEGRPRRYAAALRLVSTAASVLNHNRTREFLRPWLLELAERTAVPCTLAFYERGNVVITDVTEIIAERIVSRFDGGIYPAVCTAGGKILLAYQGEGEIQRVASIGFAPLTNYTKTTPEEILAEARLCRDRGYAVTDREYRETASAVAVPIVDRNGRAVAALSVGTRGALTDEFVESVLPAALAVAARGSSALGHTPVERVIA